MLFVVCGECKWSLNVLCLFCVFLYLCFLKFLNLVIMKLCRSFCMWWVLVSWWWWVMSLFINWRMMEFIFLLLWVWWEIGNWWFVILSCFFYGWCMLCMMRFCSFGVWIWMFIVMMFMKFWGCVIKCMCFGGWWLFWVLMVMVVFFVSCWWRSILVLVLGSLRELFWWGMRIWKWWSLRKCEVELMRILYGLWWRWLWSWVEICCCMRCIDL